MNEEISINELLQRVIEGKEPKEILIDDKTYKHNLINEIHDYIRVDEDGKIHSLFDEYNSSGILDLLNVKIEVLDKPKIEYLKYSDKQTITELEMTNKINEIIKVLNKENQND